jgi:hypothetical protein
MAVFHTSVSAAAFELRTSKFHSYFVLRTSYFVLFKNVYF